MSTTCRFLKVDRSSAIIYHCLPSADLAIMRRLDWLHLDFPFAGSQIYEIGWLSGNGRHVKTLMWRRRRPTAGRVPSGPNPGRSIHICRVGRRSHARTRSGRWTCLHPRCARLHRSRDGARLVQPPGSVGHVSITTEPHSATRRRRMRLLITGGAASSPIMARNSFSDMFAD